MPDKLRSFNISIRTLERSIETIQFMIFAIIQLLLLPLTIIGYVFSVIKAMYFSRKFGISGTAASTLGARWILHKSGVREDDASTKMVASLPNISVIGYWLTMGPSFIANRISGYTPAIARIPEPGKESSTSFVNSRTEFFDRMY